MVSYHGILESVWVPLFIVMVASWNFNESSPVESLSVSIVRVHGMLFFTILLILRNTWLRWLPTKSFTEIMAITCCLLSALGLVSWIDIVFLGQMLLSLNHFRYTPITTNSTEERNNIYFKVFSQLVLWSGKLGCWWCTGQIYSFIANFQVWFGRGLTYVFEYLGDPEYNSKDE
mmetsp:Transcript_12550/g.17807  ORF Transcript_12550/g.17807 Transcript_12550/m.17807 type:complete len:174 (-) Transcript_12550:27-548(-)